jgi:glycosyltransferase involved in cell wall biosynthesis
MSGPAGTNEPGDTSVQEEVSQSLHLVFLIRSFGFPEGMAATNRVRLLGRALIQQNVEVSVLCTRVSERPGEVRNTRASGVVDGISYSYTTGSTTRSDSFIVRRVTESRGFAAAIIELARRMRDGRLDCVYLTSLPDMWSLDVWLLLRWLRRRGVPTVIELNELPSDITWLPPAISRPASHLDAASGVVAISDLLARWASREAARIERTVSITEVPIVVDLDEKLVEPYPQGAPRLVYSASNEYGKALAYIMRAMTDVWQRHPECELIVTGMRPSMVAAILDDEGLTHADGRMHAVGYVDRQHLLRLYGEAAALLIPLFDDLRSQARFPTKIGEYLASSRPIVTNAVGEIERFFKDGESAFIARPGDSSDYAAKVIELLDDPVLAHRVGEAGRRLAEEHFDYSRQGPTLRRMLEGLSRRKRGIGDREGT